MNSLVSIDRANRKLVVNNKVLAWATGFGLVLYAVHNNLQPGLQYVFLPQLGFAIIMICIVLLYLNNKDKFTLGPKAIWIPMAVIVASMFARLIVDFSMHTFAGALFGVCLFAMYLASRILGKDILLAFIPFVIIQAVSCIGYAIAIPGQKIGGLITSPAPALYMGTANYDIATGFLVFGSVVAIFSKQYLLVSLAVLAMFLTGSEEAVFVLAVMLIVILARRDWSKRMLYPVATLAVVLIICTPPGITQLLYGQTLQKVVDISSLWNQPVAASETVPVYDQVNTALTNRLDYYKMAITTVTPLGHGYEPGLAETHTVHNVPLLIIYQIGPVAAVAWLWIMGYGLWKTRWKYAFTAILALSVFDHYIWTQLAPYWWVLVGVASTSDIKNDYIFKKV